MNIDKFINTQLKLIRKDQQKQAIKQLLPKFDSPQKITTKDIIPNIFLIHNFTGIYKKDFVRKYIVQLPLDITSEQKKIIDNKFMEDYAKKYLDNYIQSNEKKYFDIKATNKSIIYIFNGLKWLEDNIIKQPKYFIPITLEFKLKHQIPYFLNEAPKQDLANYFGEQLQIYFKKHLHLLKNRNFKFLKNIKLKLFQYKYDLQRQSIQVSLKPEVVIANFALILTFLNKSKFSKTKLNKIKKDLYKFIK